MKKIILLYAFFILVFFSAKSQSLSLCGDYVFLKDLKLNGNQFINSEKSLFLGNYTDANQRLQLNYKGGNSYIRHAGYLFFLNSKTDNMGVVFGRGANFTEILIGDRNSNNRLTLAFYETAMGGEAYISNKEGVIYISPKRTDATKGVSNNGKPIAKFDHTGLTVRGRIVTSATEWSDFVFYDNYQLPSLKEVKAHIEEHKHLPDIPSEAEVRENGIDVGEMQAKLLQKIEELTLYAIQQQEIAEKQQQMIEVLNAKIEKLENSTK